MKQKLRRTTGIAVALAALLAGCGGGGSNSTPAAVTLKGTAATGAPFAGAAITITDKTGAQVGSGASGDDGSYTITLSANATPPFVLKAVRDDLALVSIAPDASTLNVNITPITNLIASRLSSSGDPAKLAAEMAANPDMLSSSKVAAKVDEVVKLLKPLLDAIGVSDNPLTGKFSADGTGLDRALDSLSIKIMPDSANTVNIEVAVKMQSAGNEQPPLIQFTNKTTTIGELPPIDKTKLVPSGTAQLIADLMTRLTACYTLPAADRVNTANPQTATPADVKAPACKSLFLNDDPAQYKHNGTTVGVGAKTDYNGLFSDSATGVKFDRGNYDFSRANGDIVVSFRTTDKNGNTAIQGAVARAVDNKLKIVGNQYDFPGGVVAYHQLRTFINQPAADYYSTGYNFTVPNNGLFHKVVVTTPKGGTIVLLPSAGASLLNITKDGVNASGTSFIRIRSVFADAANTGNPAALDTTMAFSPTPASEDEIASYPQQSKWQFDYYLKSNPGQIAATQYYTTKARALTIGELKMQGLANLTGQTVAELKADSAQSGFVPLSFTGPAELDWEVPAGALEPTSIRIWGRGPMVSGVRTPFDDGADVKSSTRSGKIYCSKQSPSDNHCAASGNGDFALGGFINGLHLHVKDLFGREFVHFYATYMPGQ